MKPTGVVQQWEEEGVSAPARRLYLALVETGPEPVLVPTATPGPITFRRKADGSAIIPSDDESLEPAAFYALASGKIIVR